MITFENTKKYNNKGGMGENLRHRENKLKITDINSTWSVIKLNLSALNT